MVLIKPPAGSVGPPSKGCILSGKGLKTLKDVEFPPGITTLDVSHNELTSLEGCPSTITHLYAYRNQLPNFVGVPAGLKFIDAHGNPITSSKGLEACLALKTVVMYMSELSEVSGFPDSVEHLNVAANRIGKIVSLPKSIREFLYAMNRLPDEFVDKTVDELRVLLRQ